MRFVDWESLTDGVEYGPWSLGRTKVLLSDWTVLGGQHSSTLYAFPYFTAASSLSSSVNSSLYKVLFISSCFNKSSVVVYARLSSGIKSC